MGFMRLRCALLFMLNGLLGRARRWGSMFMILADLMGEKRIKRVRKRLFSFFSLLSLYLIKLIPILSHIFHKIPSQTPKLPWLWDHHDIYNSSHLTHISPHISHPAQLYRTPKPPNSPRIPSPTHVSPCHPYPPPSIPAQEHVLFSTLALDQNPSLSHVSDVQAVRKMASRCRLPASDVHS